MNQLSWIPDTDSYSYVDDEGDSFVLKKGYATSEKSELILSLEDLNRLLKDNGLNTPSNFPRYTWRGSDNFTFNSGDYLINFSLSGKELKIINAATPGSDNLTIAENGKYTAFTLDNNLFISLDTSDTRQITFDEEPGIVNGTSVHRNEFGINGGIFWSPKSSSLAFYHMDESMVTDYPLVDLTETPAKLENIKYPMAGGASHHVTIGIYNIKSETTTWLRTGEPEEQYLTSVTWSPDEKFIYVAHLNRDQNHLKLYQYDAVTGSQTKLLFEEKDNEYVEPENPLLFLPGENEKFIWFSERDGWNHLYLYDTNGDLIKRLTEGNWVVLSVEGFDNAGNLLIETTKESPLERHYYKLNINSSELTKITPDKGTHRLSSNSSGDYYIDTYSSLDIPGITRILNSDGKIIREIHKSENPLKDYRVGEVKLFTIKASDDTDLYCRLIYPPDFSADKKYPVIVYVYGGPHAQLVTDSFPAGRYAIWFSLMAQKGYIVFTLDNRGSANRGLEFEQSVFRRLGTLEVEDQLTGLDYLSTLAYIDTSRVGVFGWSYGGFMTTSLMLRGNNRYKAGVGGGAVIDWKWYEVMYGERYMDTPQDNPEGYKESSLLNYVENLSGKLLLVHGASDPVVVWQNTLSFAKKAADLNKPLDYFPYPGHGHGIGGRDALHLYTKITDYFIG